MFEKVNAAPTLSDQVAQALLARIESGHLRPGEKLPPEAALAPEFGVSRTVVREAISRLKQGVLWIPPRQWGFRQSSTCGEAAKDRRFGH